MKPLGLLLAGLAASFLEPTEGVVRVDGHDLARVRLGSYRRQLGLVLQDDFLFEGTIRENILIARQKRAEAQDRIHRTMSSMSDKSAFESFERIIGLDEANAAVFVNEWFESHEATADGMTYTIKTPTPYAWFLFRLGLFTSMIAPREALDNAEQLRTMRAGHPAG